MEKKLYRYISFETFINLVVMKKDMFKRPCKWEDTYEGFMLELLDNKQKQSEVIKQLFKVLSPQNPKATIDNFMRLWYAKWFCYGQCWTMQQEETDAMWRIYSYGKRAIRVQSTAEKIKEMLAKSPTTVDCLVEIDKVEYDITDENFINTQAELLRNTKKISDPFFHKRKAFIHEAETRVVLIERKNSFVTAVSAQFANWSLKNEIMDKNDITEEKVLKLIEKSIKQNCYPFAKENISDILLAENINLNEYIETVMIHPQAEPWIVDIVKKICENENIHCMGKSKLYGKPYEAE